MNNKNTTEQGDIPEFINLEEYNNLLCELDTLESNQLRLFETTIKIQLPEVITESIKMMSSFFYQTPMDQYLQHCVFASLIADFDRILQGDNKKLIELLKKLDNEV